ncbi:MAG: hypothetical protein HFE27_02580 [Clostridia bacterium]|jgi:hypothetical protein|nr:hypothetical protein [Clostridia bacterium]
MIKIICGAKGSGKTKKIIEAANEAVVGAKGHLIFITDTKRYMYDLKREVRFIDVTDYNVAGEEALCGFVTGAIAGGYDNEYVYLDGIARIAGKELKDMAQIFYLIEKVSELRGLQVIITCSCSEEELPEFAKKYL